MAEILKIGSRGSKLAVVQAELVASILKAAGEEVELRTIRTSGDKTDKPLAAQGGKGLFVKEIEEALLAGEIGLAVHSMKDVPGVIPEDLIIAAIPKREDPRDVFVSRKFSKLGDLPAGARVGTSSPRRQLQLKGLRPDLQILPIRGNVDTRIAKLAAGEYDAIVVAAAGLIRLGRQNEITDFLSVEVMIPSVGQGALAIEVRKNDKALIAKLQRLCRHEESAIAVQAERAFLQTVGGDCYTPLAAYAVVSDGNVKIAGYLHGSSDRIEGASTDAEELGKKLAGRLLKRNG